MDISALYKRRNCSPHRIGTADSCLRANMANVVDEIVIDKPTLSPRGREEKKMENRRHAKHTFRFDVDNGQPPDFPLVPSTSIRRAYEKINHVDYSR